MIDLNTSKLILTDDMRAMMQRWYGWGTWDARYWFIGLEPGGHNLHNLFLKIWQQLGEADLLDFKAHSERLPPHAPNWCSATATLQSTFGPLIWLLLAYQLRRDPTLAAAMPSTQPWS